MAKGDSRRGRKKYRVRYDRLVVFLLIIVTIAVLASSCVNKIRGKDNRANAPEVPKITTTAIVTIISRNTTNLSYLTRYFFRLLLTFCLRHRQKQDLHWLFRIPLWPVIPAYE